ncbi:MAG: hypothetical protein WC876_03380 [Candidatus Thermoplasmatota archaeon]|jgi:hypothetical protein
MKPKLNAGLIVALTVLAVTALPSASAEVYKVGYGDAYVWFAPNDYIVDFVPDNLCADGFCQPGGDGYGDCDEIREEVGPIKIDQNSGLGGQVYCYLGNAGFGNNADNENYDPYGDCPEFGNCRPCTIPSGANACHFAQAVIWIVQTNYQSGYCNNPTGSEDYRCMAGGGETFGRTSLGPIAVSLDATFDGVLLTAACITNGIYETPGTGVTSCWNSEMSSWRFVNEDTRICASVNSNIAAVPPPPKVSSTVCRET